MGIFSNGTIFVSMREPPPPPPPHTHTQISFVDRTILLSILYPLVYYECELENRIMRGKQKVCVIQK